MIDALKIKYNVPCQLRDGTTLMANVFYPDTDGEFPVLLTRTPYGKDFMTGFPYMDVIRLAKSGYIVVLQDVRGRGESGGEWELFINETKDGYDAVQWAAGLSGSNGNVGMWGFSYLAYTQWAAALMNPPALKAIAPTFTPLDFTNGVFWRGGALELGIMAHLLINSLGMEDIFKKFASQPEKLGSALNTFVHEIDHIPFGGLDAYDLRKLETFSNTGIGQEYLITLLENYLQPEFTGFPLSLKNRIALVDIPSLNIAGWNDIFLQDTIDAFNIQHKQGKPAKLIIGPWSHLNYSNTIGELDYGMAANTAFINMEYDHVALLQKWFNYWLNGDQNGIMDEPPVKAFIGGKNHWIAADQWPPKDARPVEWYIQSDKKLSQKKPDQSNETTQFSYDPTDPFPTHGGSIFMHPYFIPGPRDQQLLNTREDCLVFSSEPLTHSLTVTGPVSVDLFAASSTVDTDFIVALLDIHPDGKSYNITDGIVRASYRDGIPPQHLTSSEPVQFAIDLWSAGHTFLPGHRLALRITSSNFPRWDRNLNNGGKSVQPVVANQTIFMGTDHPSHICLSIYS
jgi:uncharacterized protein